MGEHYQKESSIVKMYPQKSATMTNNGYYQLTDDLFLASLVQNIAKISLLD